MNNEKDEETGGTPEATDADTSTDDPKADGENTTSTTSDQEDGTTDSDTEKTDSDNDNGNNSVPEGLTDEDKERRAELLAGTTEKVENDVRSTLGREWKEEREKNEQEKAELRTIIDTLSRGGETRPADEKTSDEPDLHRPSGEFLNEDGTVNKEALDEWNLRSTQYLNHKVEGLETLIKDLGGDVSQIHVTAEEAEQAQEFQKRYGLKPEQYQNFKSIQKNKGDFDAFEYLELEKKEATVIQAAQAHRDKQRSPGLMTNDGAPTTIAASDDAIESVVAEISKMEFGKERTTLLASIPFKYSTEISSQILRRVANS